MTSPTVDALWARIREVIGDQIVEIAAEVEAAESAATRAEHAAETAVTGVADGAVTRPKLAPEVIQELESKADLISGKVPSSQIPEVALTKPLSVTSRAELLALDAQEGDIGIITAGADKGSYMLGTGPANVFSSWIQLAVSADAPVSSVNGQTGTVVLNATDVGAAPTTHEHTMAQITDLPTITQSNVADAIVQRQANGHIQVPSSPAVGTDASSKAYVDQKIVETGVVVEWANAQKVTITASTLNAFTEGSQTGGTGLIAAWSGTSANKMVAFTKNVVCDKRTQASALVSYAAGEVIPAGTAVQPTTTGGTGPYTFTELGTTLGTLLENYSPLSVDTSVGTRVFAGDTMIHGNTGRRMIVGTSIPALSGTGSVYITRYGNFVTMEMSIYRMDSSSGGKTLFSIPIGFRPPANMFSSMVANRDPLSVFTLDIMSNGAVQEVGTPMEGRHYGFVSWITNNAWPSVLPGLPA